MTRPLCGCSRVRERLSIPATFSAFRALAGWSISLLPREEEFAEGAAAVLNYFESEHVEPK